MYRVNVLIIDKRFFFRAGVRQTLAQRTDIKILDCAKPEDALAVIESTLPDIAILGSSLDDHCRVELAKKIQRQYPNTKVIMPRPRQYDEELLQSIDAKDIACLSNKPTSEELISTIERVSRRQQSVKR